jgi:predicted MPP superfamily phosphohydrolase
VLLLVHQPEAFVQAASLGFPLVLSGHTHGGQIALPLPGGHVNLARVMTPMTRGSYRRGGTLLYVNRGLGVGGPAMRINCDREIATLELVAPGSDGVASGLPDAVPPRAPAQRT